MDCRAPGLPVPHHLLKFAQVHVHCIGDAVQPSHPLTPSSPSALSFSLIRDFSSVRIRWPKYWSFSFSPSSEYSVLISLKIDCLISLLPRGLLGVFSSTTVWRHQFFGILPSLWSSSHNRRDHWEDSLDCLEGYVIALAIQTFVDRVNVSAFQHTRFVLTSLPRSSCFLISWLQSPSAVILEPKRGNSSLLPPFPLLFAVQ